jgi:hypothetical protein
MNSETKQRIIFQILSGKLKCTVRSKDYYVHTPTPDILYEAQEIYLDAVEVNKYCRWMTEDRLKKFLIYHDFISEDFDENLVSIEKRIEDLKVDLFNCAFSKNQQDKTRVMLDRVRDKHDEMVGASTSLNHITLKGFAESIKTFYIFSKTIYNKVGKRLKCTGELVNRIMNSSFRSRIKVSEFREIARSEPWRSYWNSKKEELFTNIYGQDQRTLILYSKMYDNAFQHQECPVDDVIDDDDMFDGWMISLRRERQQGQMKSRIEEQLGSRHSKASDLFIGGGKGTTGVDSDAAQKIYEHNTPEGRRVQKERDKFIKKHGSVAEHQLPDVKRGNMMAANNKFRKTVKRGKGK